MCSSISDNITNYCRWCITYPSGFCIILINSLEKKERPNKWQKWVTLWEDCHFSWCKMVISKCFQVGELPSQRKEIHENISKTEAQSCLFKTNQYKYQQPWWCSCLYRHTWYRKSHTAMLQYSKRASIVYRVCKVKLLLTNIFNALFSFCIFNLVFSANCSEYLFIF